VQFRDPEIHQGTAVARVRGARVRRSQHRSRPRWVFPARARRAVSVLIWIACAVAPPYGRRGLPSGGYATVTAGDTTRMARERMVREQIGGRGVKNAAVLSAMRRVPRHKFMPEAVRRFAYDDRPVPIGMGQTISQPYIVALMTELAAVDAAAACLRSAPARLPGRSARRAWRACLLDRAPGSAEDRAVDILAQLGYAQVKTRVGDGYLGWPEAAPFDAIIVTAAPPACRSP